MKYDSRKSVSAAEFMWSDAGEPDSHSFLAPTVLRILDRLAKKNKGRQLRVLDLGCGNGSFSAKLASLGYLVSACDNSISGVGIAKNKRPDIQYFQQEINEPLSKEYWGQFDVVVSLEVLEHLFFPRNLFARAKEALRGHGRLIVSTPYHGYLKNIVLALFNKFDDHWHPLKDFGHIKFFSKSTLMLCATECGFKLESFNRVGRIPSIAKCMIAEYELE